jgi:hypothetical protein
VSQHAIVRASPHRAGSGCDNGPFDSHQRGRERVSVWNARPENRQLPSVLEWANNNGTPSVAINTYAVQLVIAPTNGTLTPLAFSAPTSQQLGYVSDSNYIFVNDSFAAVPPPFVGLPTSTVYVSRRAGYEQ